MHWPSQTYSPAQGNYTGAGTQGSGGKLTFKIERNDRL